MLKFVLLFKTEIGINSAMKNPFDQLKKHYRSHKSAAKALGVSYSRYNDWRWAPDKMPRRARTLVELAAAAIETSCACNQDKS